MKANFSVNTPTLSEASSAYQEMSQTVATCVIRLEQVRSNLSGCSSYSEIKCILITLEEEQKDNIQTLKSMGGALTDIVQCYEDTENKIINATDGVGDISEGDGSGESLEDLLDDLIKMLKGINQACCAYGGDPVNFATGNFVYHREYLQLKGLFPMAFQMVYNSMEQAKGVLGKGWVHNYEIIVRQEYNRAVVHWSDGREAVFLKEKNGCYRHLIGKQESLRKIEDGLLYETTFGIQYFFDQRGRNTKVSDTNGNLLIHCRMRMEDSGMSMML